MKRLKRISSLFLGSLIFWIFLTQSTGVLPILAAKVAQAANTSPTPPPARSTTIKVSFTLYEWWLIQWSTNQVVCQVWIEHDGVPLTAEIQYYCGDAVLAVWLQTQPCVLGDTITSYAQCPGYYLHRAHATPGERTIQVKLAPPSVNVTISGCDLSASKNYCDTLPGLMLTGVEPLPGEEIIRIQGLIAGQPFSCPGSTCILPIPPTSPQGATVEFWADSSFGDSSAHFTAQVRAIPWGDFTSPEGMATDQPRWYIDVISSQWQGLPLASCSQTWGSFPPVGGPPGWLTTPNDVSQLKSDVSYVYLAGALIQQGVVNASDCPNNGLQAEGVANACGVTAAQDAVVKWQNQFDTDILQVANDTNVPAQLLKNVFSRESQFWPGIFQTYKEAGLGQLTDNGADTALLWNSDFFSQFCPLVFKTQVCEQGYGNLTPDQQALLRGAMVQKVNAACPNCPSGIDLTQANFSISVFARSLLANCGQVGQMIYNTTNEQAGLVSTYEDLWKFTLVNYNAGPGCLGSALQTAFQKGEPLSWQNVSSLLDPACQGAIQYVNDVSQGPPAATPGQTGSPPVTGSASPGTPSPGPTGTSSPTPGASQTPTPVSTPTATQAAYPPAGTQPTSTQGTYP